MKKLLLLCLLIPMASLPAQGLERTRFDVFTPPPPVTVDADGRPGGVAQEATIALTAEERQWLEQHPHLRFVAVQNQPPFSMLDGKGGLVGILSDLFAELGRAIGQPLELEPVAEQGSRSASAKAAGVYGDGAVLVSSVEAGDYLTTEPYLTTAFFAYTTRNNLARIHRAEDLRGLRVAIPRGHLAMAAYLEGIGGVETMLVDSPLEQMQKVVSGKADALIGYLTYPYLINKYLMTDLAIAFVAKEEVGVRIGVNPEHPMLQRILDKAIASLSEQRKMAILAQWNSLGIASTQIRLNDEERLWLERHPVLRVAVNPRWAPLEFLDEHGKLQGISSDYLKRLEELLGVRFEPAMGLSWQEAMAEVKAGRLDLFASLRDTPEREDHLAFTDPYLSVPIVFFTGSNVAYIGDPKELCGKQVAVVEGDAVQELLAKDYPGIELVTVKDIPEGLNRLAAGKVYAFADNILSTGYYIRSLGLTQLKVSGQTPYANEQALAARKELPLLASILRKALAAIPDEERNNIYQRWIAVQVEQRIDHRLLWQVLAGAALLLGLFGYWVLRLRAEVLRRRSAEQAVRKTAEQLRVAEQFASGTIDALQAHLCVLDATGVILAVNAAWREFADANPPLVPHYGVGANYLSLCDQARGAHSEEAQQAAAGLRRVLAGRDERFRLEYPCNAPSNERWFLMTATRFGDAEPACVVVAHEEITEQYRAKQLLAAARDVAEAANLAKSAFLANMSHELRTPLNAILGFSQLLARESDLAPRHRERIDTINRAGEHLLAMINDVLDLSKIEAGKTELRMQSFDWVRMLRDLSEMFRFRAQSKGLAFQLELGKPRLATIRVDEGKLRQVLINLLGNAVKFTPAGRVILRAFCLPPTATGPEYARLRVEVEDSGIGIAPDQLPHIFEPFVQVGSSNLAEQHGTGLGLAITRSFIQLMGGRIEAESTPGKGSCFCIEVPVEAGDPLAASQKERREVVGLKPGQEVPQVLVVDDEADNRALLSDLLTGAGFSVREASNGTEALEAFAARPAQFVWLDLRMPVLDGYETARRLRALPGGAQVPIIAVTANTFGDDRARALAADCNEVVTKPFTANAMFEVMRRYLKVDYLYRDLAAQGESSPTVVLTAEAFAQLSTERLQELLDAVLWLDVETVAEVSARLREQSPLLAEQVQALAVQFHFGRLLELCEQALEQRRGGRRNGE